MASRHEPPEKKRIRCFGGGSGAVAVAKTGSENFAPPPTASTDTASTTSSLAGSMKPNRALWVASKPDFRSSTIRWRSSSSSRRWDWAIDAKYKYSSPDRNLAPLRYTLNAGTIRAVSVPEYRMWRRAATRTSSIPCCGSSCTALFPVSSTTLMIVRTTLGPSGSSMARCRVARISASPIP